MKLFVFITNISSQNARKTIIKEIHKILCNSYRIIQTTTFQPTMETNFRHTSVDLEDVLNVVLKDKKSNMNL